MSTLDAQVERLRRLLRSSQDFGVPAAYFFDEVAEDPAALGVQERHARLELTLRRTIAALMPTPTLADLLILRVPGTSMLHGAALMRGAVCAFFYFEDDDRGLVVLDPLPRVGRTHYLRFTVTERPDSSAARQAS